jgi:uncharacterized protein, PH0010 family
VIPNNFKFDVHAAEEVMEMGKLLKAFLMPHPPIAVEEVGEGREVEISNTINSALKVGEEISRLKPDTIVIVVPPHGPAFGDAMSLSVENPIEGNLGRFGASEVRFSFDTNIELANLIIKRCADKDIPVVPVDKEILREYRIPDGLDHGSMVPLYFINKKYSSFKLIHITYGILSNEELYQFGRVIRESIENSSSNAVFIASGDLSHRLTHDAPAGYSPLGAGFDETIVKYLHIPDSDRLMEMDKSLIDAAGECGYRSILTLLGTMDGMDAGGNVLSYEGPFGVGYCVASYNFLGENSDNNKVEYYYSKRKLRVKSIRESEDDYVRLARMSLEYYIKHMKAMAVPENLPEEMVNRRAGVFVSIKKGGELRGCIGTTGPVQDSIAEEIIENAISTGTKDPRFYPVEEAELEELVYSVDVLGEPEPIKSKDELDPAKYGVIVRKGGRSGLLLPDLEGVDTADEQVSIALRKAGIGENENYSMERFEVIRHK